MPALLEAENLEAQYGWTKVLHGLRFAVEAGGITTILGANGAGKTTTLRAVCGMVKTAGTVRFEGRRIDGKATEEIVRLGIAHTPEGRGTFMNLTVQENLRLGAYVRKDRTAFAGDFERVFQYFPVLGQRQGQQAGTLSGGEQQMLAVARGLMSRPRLLLLDEPSLGLAPRLVAEVWAALAALRDEGLTLLVVEQMAEVALETADRGYVLEHGRIVLAAAAGDLLRDERVARAYLGRERGRPVAPE